MVRVLQIVDKLSLYGTEVFLMNVFRNLDREKIMFDFLVSERSHSVVEKEAEKLGSRIFTFSHRRLGWRKHIKSLHEFYREHASEYKAIHINGNCFSGMMPLAIGAKYGIPIRIAHCHSTSTRGLHNKILHKLNRLRIHKIATHYLACSEAAKRYGFGETPVFDKALQVTNGIDLEKFKFNHKIREAVRKDLKLGDELVIGNVAGFRDVKNHPFMIQVMDEVVKTHPNAKLLLVGDGQLMPEIQKLVETKGLENNIIFLGSRTDIPQLLQGMDVFLFPSKYEGLGISIIEAQAAGLPVFASDTIPRETNVSPLIHYLSLNMSARDWAQEIIKSNRPDRNIEYPGLKIYDIIQTCQIFNSIYLS